MDTLPEHSNTRRDLYLEESCNANFSYKISFTAVVPEHNINFGRKRFSAPENIYAVKNVPSAFFFFF